MAKVDVLGRGGPSPKSKKYPKRPPEHGKAVREGSKTKVHMCGVPCRSAWATVRVRPRCPISPLPSLISALWLFKWFSFGFFLDGGNSALVKGF